MNVYHAQLPLGPKANELFSWIGSVALLDGNQEAAEICRNLVHELGDTEITVKVDCLHILCQACDAFRDQPELLAKVESLVKLLKPQPRKVLGTLDLKIPSLTMLDHALESLRKTVLTGARQR